MKLKSFGCSFIYGTELHDNGHDQPWTTASNHTWPALLARHHGYLYTCYARPGAGNLHIAERMISQLVTDSEPAVYVVAWTWIDRFNFTDVQDSSKWRTIMPTDSSSLAKHYYTNFHSEFRDKLTSLINVKLCIDMLQARSQRFIMTYMDELMFDNRWNTTPAVIELQNLCRPYMTQFDNKNFVDWSKDQGYQIGPGHHPLESAHQGAFELINSYNLV